MSEQVLTGVVVKCRRCYRPLTAFVEVEDVTRLDSAVVMVPACPDHRAGPRRGVNVWEWARRHDPDGFRAGATSWPDGPTLRADRIVKELARSRRKRRIRVITV